MQRVLFAALALLLLPGCHDDAPVIPGLPTASFAISTDPAGTTIQLNTYAARYTSPLAVDGVDPGFYKISLSKEHYLDTFYYFLLKRGDTGTLFFEMREDPGYWWRVYRKENSQLPTNQLTAVFCDRQNRLWAGTAGSGAAVLHAGTWQQYTSQNSGLPGDNINAVFQQSNGDIWIATSAGVSRFGGNGSWLTFTSANSPLPDNNVTCIGEDTRGNLWFGTFSGGLAQFTGTAFIVYTVQNSGLPSNTVKSLAGDDQGNIWAGTWGGGLARFSGAEWKQYNVFNKQLPDDYVAALLWRNGTMWAGCGSALSGGGLAAITSAGSKLYRGGGSTFPGSKVSSLAADAAGNVWIGTTDGGLGYYNGSFWRQYSTANSGIPTGGVQGVTVDAEQNKWVAAEGLGRYIGRK